MRALSAVTPVALDADNFLRHRNHLIGVAKAITSARRGKVFSLPWVMPMPPPTVTLKPPLPSSMMAIKPRQCANTSTSSSAAGSHRDLELRVNRFAAQRLDFVATTVQRARLHDVTSAVEPDFRAAAVCGLRCVNRLGHCLHLLRTAVLYGRELMVLRLTSPQAASETSSPQPRTR